MPYPTLDGPYGLKPVNLIGGQVFSGSTRMIPILQGNTTAIYTGDVVEIVAPGVLQLSALVIPTTTQGAQAARPGTVGVFLGCEYTPSSGPLYGKQRYSYWPGVGAASITDAVGYVVDDPDTVFRTAVLSMPAGASNTATTLGTTIGYMSPAFVGTNVYYAGANVGSAATGNATSGVVGNTAGAGNGNGNIVKTSANVTTFRVVGLVPDTAVSVATSLTTAASTTTLAVASTTGVFPGMQVVVPAATGNGQAGFNNYVTAVTSSTAVTVASAITAANGSAVAFVGYPEVLVKFNFGHHGYYNATSI